ncbi:MAG: XRE family transcriptional regulator [Hyphomicrobiales bacterium]|nr:XRE family transcriptional regulator [Hyphomicrobiales bacterium]
MSMRGVRKGNQNLDSDVTPALGKTIQRLRKAYKLSLGELSEQSGVAKSIISQIERNETNPTIGTVERLSRALDTTIGEVLKSDAGQNFFEHQGRSGIPKLESEDGLCTLAIIGALDLVEYVQWYDFRARPGGILESEPHQAGCVEHLYVIDGELEITVAGEVRQVTAGQSIRYAGDRPHSILNAGQQDAHATMVLVMRAP